MIWSSATKTENLTACATTPVNAMLLNEFLKEHKKVQKLEATLEAVNARLQEQAAQIQKVTAQVDATKPLPHLVRNNP